MVNYKGIQKIVDRQIQRFGGGKFNAALRRDGTDRQCTVVDVRFISSPRKGSLTQFNEQTIIVSAIGLDVDPDNELDTFIQQGVEYRIIKPPAPLKPDGVTILYWELAIER